MKKSPLLVAPLLAAALSSPTVLAEMSEAELEAELEAVASRLGEGYSPSGKTMTGGLAEGQTKRWTRSLEAGTCYRFVAVGGELVEDLDLKVYSGADLVASDGGAVSTPVAHYCTDADTSVEMRLQMYEGQGQFAIGLYARGGPSEDAPLEASEGERAMLAKLAETAGRIAPGTDPVAAPVAGTLAYRNAHSIEVPLSESSCYKFLAVGGAGVTDMILGVSVDGVEVASDRISGRNPVAQWCAPRSAKATVKLTMYAGGGPFALGAYRTRAAAAEAPEKVGGSESDFVANRLKQLHMPTIRHSFEETADQARAESWSYEQYLLQLLVQC